MLRYKGIRLYDSVQSGATTGEFVNQGTNLAAIIATVGIQSPYLSTIDDEHPNNAGQTQLVTMVESYLEDE